MQKKIRIMHVTGGLDVGGVEELLFITAKYNLDNKYDLAVVGCHSTDGYASRQIQRLGYHVFGLDITNRLYDLRIIPKLIRIFKIYKPHIVHIYFKINFFGRIAAKITGVPVIICNEVDMDWHGWLKIIAVIKRRLDFFTDKVIECSDTVGNYWNPKKSKKHLVMYLPIDMEKFNKINEVPEDRLFKNGLFPIIGIVARLFPRKGHEYLIKAMPKILSYYPSAKLKIIGTGPLLVDLKALTSALNLEDSIIFTGFVKDLYPELFSLDVFITASLTEGFPLTIVEAMVAGIPIAATPVGGIPEIVEHGKTGYLFPSKNTDAVAKAVIRLLSNFEKAKKMGERGKEKALKLCSPEVYIKRLDELYEELLAEKGKR